MILPLATDTRVNKNAPIKDANQQQIRRANRNLLVPTKMSENARAPPVCQR